MSTWSSGYVSEIEYTHGYYAELNPLHAKFLFLCNGIEFPQVRTACELGTGQGLSTLIHSAASTTSWYGNDFNPNHAVFAQRLAQQSMISVDITDDSFSEYLTRSDLPKFDFIGLHGVWSWVSDENRKAIVDFVKEKLNLGGVLYVSYNCPHGWSSFDPIRTLLYRHSITMGSRSDGVAKKVRQAVDFVNELVAANPTFATRNEALIQRIEKLKDADVSYLAHEYFNKDWSPSYFSEVEEALGDAKLSYVCSAGFTEQVRAISLLPEQIAFLDTIHDKSLYQDVKDLLTATGFRRDYWVKGSRRITNKKQNELLNSIQVSLMSDHKQFSYKLEVPSGEADLKREIYEPVIESLASKPLQTVSQLREVIGEEHSDTGSILQVLLVLLSKGIIGMPQEIDHINSAYGRSTVLNKNIIELANTETQIKFLASPVFGGGIAVNKFEQLFLLAISRGLSQLEDIVSATWDYLDLNNQRLVSKGRELMSVKENEEHLTSLAREFLEKRYPFLIRAQVIKPDDP